MSLLEELRKLEVSSSPSDYSRFLIANLDILLADLERAEEERADLFNKLMLTEQRADRLGKALTKIASCESHVAGDVVDIARIALAATPEVSS